MRKLPQRPIEWASSEDVYGNYSNKSYAKQRSKVVHDGLLTKYYSYSTVVAFQSPNGFHICQNEWSTTTGKHLNWLDGGSRESKRKRLSHDSFKRLLENAERENQRLRSLVEAFQGSDKEGT